MAIAVTRRRTRRRAIAISLGAVLAGTACAPDPPSAVVGVAVSACALTTERGSGILVANDLVLTSAHVLRGARSITVERSGADPVPAEIVGFDPDMDLAYLAIPPIVTSPLIVDSDHVEKGDRGRAWVVRDGLPVPIDVAIRRRVRIRTEDIYVDGETSRPGLELDGDIRPGDSGGAVVVDGTVVGVVWARSRRFPGRGYAIDPDRAGERIREQLLTGTLGPDIDLDRCS